MFIRVAGIIRCSSLVSRQSSLVYISIKSRIFILKCLNTTNVRIFRALFVLWKALFEYFIFNSKLFNFIIYWSLTLFRYKLTIRLNSRLILIIFTTNNTCWLIVAYRTGITHILKSNSIIIASFRLTRFQIWWSSFYHHHIDIIFKYIFRMFHILNFRWTYILLYYWQWLILSIRRIFFIIFLIFIGRRTSWKLFPKLFFFFIIIWNYSFILISTLPNIIFQYLYFLLVEIFYSFEMLGRSWC